MFNIFKLFKKKEPWSKDEDLARGPTEQGGSVRAYERENKDGERETVIIGEKHVMRGHSRGSLLDGGKLAEFKNLIRLGVKVLGESESKMIPQENLKLPVRMFAETCDEFIEMEQYDEMKAQWRRLKKGTCFFLEDDDAYCFRFQLFVERLALRLKKIKLTKADRYYFFKREDFNPRKYKKL